MFDGTTSSSEKQLPLLSEDVASYHQNLEQIPKNVLPISDGIIKDSFFVSFADTAKLLHHHNPVIISNNAWLAGKVIVSSDISITVKKDAWLNDVILQAPQVVFESGFTGSAQVFATDSILVQPQVSLKYPSALVLDNISETATKAYIHIADHSKVSGAVLVPKSSFKINGAVLYIEPKGQIEGMVYVAGKVSLKGKIAGSLYCQGFYLRTASSVYENYLLDATIDITALHPIWQQPILLKDQVTEGYIKWLY